MDSIMSNVWAGPLKYVIMAVAVVMILEKTIGIKTLLKFIKGMGKGAYTYKQSSHCNDAKLLSLLDDFKQKKFDKVKNTLLDFSADYRAFALSAMGEMEAPPIAEWIKYAPNDDLPKVVLASHNIARAWKIRGIGAIDTVSSENISRFKSILNETKDILLESKKTPSAFDINKDVFLLTLFKAMDLDSREIIHQTFQHALSIDPKHIGVHLAYFTAISEKWGGTEQELKAYLSQVPDAPTLLGSCVQAMYYWDLTRVYQVDDEATISNIKHFIMQADKGGLGESNLYRYELYLRLYWLSSVHYEALEDKYYQLVKPYWDDK